MVFSGEKSHTCGVCGKRFAVAVQLERHQRVHTGETLLSISLLFAWKTVHPSWWRDSSPDVAFQHEVAILNDFSVICAHVTGESSALVTVEQSCVRMS